MMYKRKLCNRTSKNLTSIIFSAFLLLVCFLGTTDSAQAKESGGMGSVDTIHQDGNRIIAQGWVGADAPTQQIVSISVWLADKKIYDGQFERFQRPDVVQATGRPDWLSSGWRVSFLVPSDATSGSSTVKINAKFDTGKEILLVTNQNSESIVIDGSVNKKSYHVRIIKVLIALVILTLVVLFFYAERISNWIKIKTAIDVSPPKLFGAALIAVFLIFVSAGFTGSSFGFGLSQAPFIKTDMINISGKNQGIRSDEWLVLTPLAIAQFNHVPANPIVNSNHGEDGQNMLIVGMTGVPVWHISAIAKPATWGYFVFDLKRALAWNWLFPIFSCLIVLWAVISIMIPGNWRASFLVALLFSSAPYVVAWSNWPAYAVFFPSLIFVCANSILRSESMRTKLSLSVLLGVSFAGFVFVLYPPWQVSLAYIYIALTIGLIIRDKLYISFNRSLLVCLVTAIAISATILTLWWIDAKDAIQAMENTVYPGQRTTVVGGTMSLPTLLRGFTNIITLQKLNSPISNQSEIASFSYMLLPLAFLFCIRAFQKSLTALEISLAGAIAFILIYMFIGIPSNIAKYSLWGRVPSNRADLALGLACIILTGLLLINCTKQPNNKNLVKIFSLFISFVWAYISYRAISGLNETILTDFNANLMLATVIIISALGYFLATSNFKAFIYLNLSLYASTTILFNPINIAPTNVTNTSDTLGASSLKNTRVLVLENMTPAMYLVSSGTAVANGIFYYPQRSLWKRLDPDALESDTYNRYQHLTYAVDEKITARHFSVETPRPDVVNVKVNLETFDFHLSGANILTAPMGNKDALSRNENLAFITEKNGWCWFSITD